MIPPFWLRLLWFQSQSGQPYSCLTGSSERPSWQTLYPLSYDAFAKISSTILYDISTVAYLSAPAHDNILLMRTMWKGCGLILRWKASLPQCFTRYLLAQIRPASRASDDSCSSSSDTRCTHRGNSSTRAFLRPRS